MWPESWNTMALLENISCWVSVVVLSMTVAFGAMSDWCNMNVRGINVMAFKWSCLMKSNALSGHLVNKLQNGATDMTGGLIHGYSVCEFTSAVTSFQMSVLWMGLFNFNGPYKHVMGCSGWIKNWFGPLYTGHLLPPLDPVSGMICDSPGNAPETSLLVCCIIPA